MLTPLPKLTKLDPEREQRLLKTHKKMKIVYMLQDRDTLYVEEERHLKVAKIAAAVAVGQLLALIVTPPESFVFMWVLGLLSLLAAGHFMYLRNIVQREIVKLTMQIEKEKEEDLPATGS